MNINATLFGELIFGLAVMVAIICFFLGKQKGQNPLLTAVIGFFSALVPIIALVYMIVLFNKPSVQTQNTTS